jgi:hypothetical protein
MRVGKLLAHAHAIPPQVGAWTVAIAGTIAGVLLTRKALRE